MSSFISTFLPYLRDHFGNVIKIVLLFSVISAFSVFYMRLFFFLCFPEIATFQRHLRTGLFHKSRTDI